MKILYAPYNIASMPAITVEELNNLAGVTARGICIDTNKFLYFGKEENKVWEKFHVDSNIGKNWFLFLYNLVLAEIFLIYRITWCDVIIWQWDIKKYMPHYWLIKLLKKPIIVEWLGSDIRIPEVVKQNNKYYKAAWVKGNYTYTKESSERSKSIQTKFKKLNAVPLLCPEMTLFLNKELYKKYFIMMQRVNVSKFNVKIPLVQKQVPVICHAPSAYGAKGTFEVREIIKRLSTKYNFEYVEIHGMEHKEALKIIECSDIFLDQFILGSYGMATCEALSMGKPVFCYLMNEVLKLLPEDCPILPFGLDELENELPKLILSPNARNKIGLKSRKYMEDHHDSKILTPILYQYLENYLQ